MSFGGSAIGYPVYEWVKNNLPLGSTILELGSGSGSSELSKIYNYYCVEHDRNWVNKFSTINYIYAPIVNGWYDTWFLPNLPKDYTLLLVDGPPGSIGRNQFIKYAHHFNLSVPILIDDTERQMEKDIVENLVKSFNKTVLTTLHTDDSAFKSPDYPDGQIKHTTILI